MVSSSKPLILQNTAQHISLSPAEEKRFLSLLTERTYRRKEVLLKKGEVCRHSFFVVDGALKTYGVDKTGTEHVMSFAVAGWWTADMYSLITQKPGVLVIEALADSTVLLLSKENQSVLFAEIPKFEKYFRILVENALVASQQRLLDNLSLTAAERYVNFTRKYPFILECAPLHSIASYLGITPEFLSKIRRKLATPSSEAQKRFLT